jgi:hypothetical protein
MDGATSVLELGDHVVEDRVGGRVPSVARGHLEDRED